MKKTEVLVSLILEGTLTVFLISYIFILLWVVHLKENKNNFLELKKKIIYTHDTAFTNGQVHQWSLKIKVYMIYF